MKKLIKKIVSNIRTAATRAAIAWQVFRSNPFGCVKRALTAGASGEGYIDTAVFS